MRVESLRDAACYPHPVEAIRILETHISWIVLTGAIAYKIKKPVRLSFLDYATLERRHFFCLEELRRNRLYAAGLYLGLSRISPADGGYAIDASNAGPVVEYAVRLRQFDGAQQLSRLLADAHVSPAEIAQLGRELGKLHEHAARAPCDETYGSSEATHAQIAECSADLRRHASRDEIARVERIDEWLRERTAITAHRMESRRATGAVRECHGDLHADNVVRFGGRLVAFDCIEFDPALVFIDIANDAAFLYMDLLARGHRDRAHAFLDGWLETTGDHDALKVLREFAVYRALVRARVAAIGPAGRRGGAGDAISRYLDAAAQLIAVHRPVLAITVGLSGSGKSALAAELIERLPAVRLRSDVERKRLAGIEAEASSRSAPGAGIYTSEYTERTYARLLDGASAALEGGFSVVLDAAHLRRAEREAARRHAAQRGAVCVQIWCDAPEAELRRRVESRLTVAREASEATLEVLDKQMTWFEPIAPVEQSMTIRIDTSRSSPTQLAAECAQRIETFRLGL
jgi:aminoglycoside phosphotransferase family enzyme/predicted kinase